MKRVIISLIILGAAVGISTWSHISVMNELDSLKSSLESVLVSPENELDSEIEALGVQWEGCRKKLHALLMHEGIDEMAFNILNLVEYNKKETGNKEIIQQYCVEAISRIENMKISERVSLENIF